MLMTVRGYRLTGPLVCYRGLAKRVPGIPAARRPWRRGQVLTAVPARWYRPRTPWWHQRHYRRDWPYWQRAAQREG